MHSTGACVGFVAAAALCIHSGFALAQPTPPPADQPDSSSALSVSAESPHLPRVFVGARLGLGELHFHLGESNTWGRSYPIQAWAGVALTDRLVLLFELYDAHIFNPSSTYAELTAFNLVGLGPGLKYYLTPKHLYLSASLLWTRASFSGPARWGWDGELDEHTQWGLGGVTGRLAVGREWQMTPNWRLGLEGEALLGRMDHATLGTNSEEQSTVKGFSLLFAATYHDPADGRLPATASSAKPHTRQGLYLNARLGVGTLEARFGNYPASGTILPISLSAGWSVTQRLVLYAGVSHGQVDNVEDGYTPRSSAVLDSVGPGLKYYLTSSNLFLSSSVELARINFDYDSSSDTLQTRHRGFVARVAYGKEWWLSNRWGIGVAAEVMLGRLHYGDEGAYGPGASYMPQQLSLLASATYNHSPGDEADTSPTDPTGAPLPASEHHTHDGFYAGVRLGLGWLEIARSGTDGTVSGWGRPFALSAGFAVVTNLIVFGEFYSAQIRKPSASYDHLVDSDLLAFGPGVTYYLMPSNIFASCSVLVSQLGYRDANPGDWRYGYNIGSNWGLAGRFAVGKELWASSNWGLGIAGEMVLGRMRETDIDSTLTIKGFSMIASASFN